MQVGDYIIRHGIPSIPRHYRIIGLIVETYPDAYFKMEPKAYYDTFTKEYKAPLTDVGIYLTKTRTAKGYPPTLEELFIFKQIEENPNGTYTLQK
jgi:hypothetical protein